MMHPLLQLIVKQPQLLADHAEAYAELVTVDISTALSGWKRRLMLNALALACLVVAAVLAGVALMLWAMIPDAGTQAHWLLMATPTLFAAIAAACLLTTRTKPSDGVFDNVRQQVQADLLLLREAGNS